MNLLRGVAPEGGLLITRFHVKAAFLARVAVGGIAAFPIIILLLHALESEFEPANHMVSEYALGDYGHLLNAAALFLALGSAALAIGLRQALRPQPLLPAVLLVIWSAGAVTAGFFNTDPKGASEATSSGEVHTVAVVVAVLALTCAASLSGQYFQRDARWRTIATPTRWWALAMLVTTVVTVLSAESEFGGIVQRIWIAVLIGWLIFVANHLRSIALDESEENLERGPE